MKNFDKPEQMLAFSWLIKPDNYQKRPEITNFMKKYYTKKDLTIKFEDTFTQLTKHILSNKFSNDENKYIINAEKCIINCLKFDELDGFQGLFLYIFFLYPPLIGRFWLFAFCGEPIPLASPEKVNSSSFASSASPPNFSNQPFINQSYYPNQNPPNSPYQPNQSYFANSSMPPQNQLFNRGNPFPINQNQQFYANSSNHSFYGNQAPTPFNPIPNYVSSENQINAENPGKFVDALCSVIKYACEFSCESREFITYFLSRFLVKGLKVAAIKLNPSHLIVIVDHLQKLILYISQCGCSICSQSFERCCQAYNYVFQASLSIHDDHFHFDISNFIISLLEDLAYGNRLPPFFLNCFLDNIIIQIKPIYFERRIKNIISIILNIGLELTYSITNIQPDLMKSCMDILNKYFNYIEDSDLLTDCIRFFYLNRFYEPFRGITQRIASNDLKSKINLEKLDDIITDSMAEEEEGNEIESGVLSESVKDKEYKEYVRLFNDLRGKGKKKKMSR